MVFVYLLRCADGSLYCGWTTDVERRLAAHRSGTGSRYTRSRRPVELAAVIPVADRSAALREEARVKRLPRAAKLRLVEASTGLGEPRPRVSISPLPVRLIRDHSEKEEAMKYMLLIHQGDTPTPRDPEAWGRLSEEEQQEVYAAYQGINQTPGVTAGEQMDSPENATTVRVEDGK